MTTLGQQFLFIVGAPRSGTTWLHRMLAAHPQVAALETELTVFAYLNLWHNRYQQEKFHIDQGHWKQGAPLLYPEDEFYQGLRSMALDAYGRVLAKHPSATHILDKYPNYALHIPLIHQLFPHCKVIHIIRDGREVAVSMMSAKKRIGFGAGEIRGAARHWATNLRTARNEGQRLGNGHYMEIRYEDLMADPAGLLGKVLDFSGLPLPQAEVERIAQAHAITNKQVSRGDPSLNELRKKPGGIWQTRLNLEQRWTMDRMVGDLLHELGYGEPGWWALNGSERFRMRFHPMKQRILRSLGNLKHIWLTPVENRMEP